MGLGLTGTSWGSVLALQKDSMSSFASPVPASPTKGQVFLRRLISTVCLWVIVLTAMFSGNPFIRQYVFLTLMLILAATGLLEFYGLVEKRGLACFKVWGLFNGLLLMTGTFFYVTTYQKAAGFGAVPGKANDFETIVLIFFVLGLCVREFVSKERQTVALTAMSTTLLGLMYVPWLLNFVQKINFLPTLPGHPLVDGRFYVLYFIVVTKFSDLGAYCTGSLIGRHKMIPRISPGKTWEGMGGAIVVSTLTSVVFAHWAGPRLAGMNLTHALILGVIMSVAAVIGDLIESIFKREAGVKDSGKFFPGIGGILDLLDSLLFNAPLMYLYLRHVLAR